MSGDESIGKRSHESALNLGPKKKPRTLDPLVHHGRHFGRTVHGLCNVYALLTAGLLRLGELSGEPEESFTYEQRREYRVFEALLQMVPGLEDRLMNGSENDVVDMAESLQRGVSGARSDDTRSLKGPVLDWITPRGQSLNPPLSRNVKMDRGFQHERTGSLLCPVGMDWTDPEVKAKLRSGETSVPGDCWPIFLYAGHSYDPEDPWKGLLRNPILISAYKHVFTSPSSVDKNEVKATRSGNARLHGMTCVTPPSIAYIATQVRFALSSASVFSRTDTVTDSERFYNSILELLADVEEKAEVDELLAWWNRQIFPNYSSSQHTRAKNLALAKIKERRARLRETGIEGAGC